MHIKLSKDDKHYEIKLSTLNTEKSESLETPENFDIKKKKKKRKKNTLSLLRKRRRNMQKQQNKKVN